ncbi:hypothetical protein D9757_013051 [Collybiopsis confluens]|uniref:Uncharacterized protein n=1 Tax=Collybiopsis confluens TaxID=2823264 RepID=A0A8H5GGZ0_9AGAR|nr:hypothetical protein D9757_013051 [Collybiopsis confluens]
MENSDEPRPAPHADVPIPPIPPPLTLPPPSPRILFLPKLKDITFTINAMVQAVSLRHFVASRWYARNDVPPPVACLKRIRVYLAVPYVPNVELAIGPIERVFTRIANGYGRNTGQRTVVELMRHVIRSGLQDQEVYDGIERLDRLPISEWMIG